MATGLSATEKTATILCDESFCLRENCYNSWRRVFLSQRKLLGIDDATFMSLSNPNSIGIKYFLIVWGWGLFKPYLCFDLLIGQELTSVLFLFIKTLGDFYDILVVSNREICFIKAVLSLCEHGHFFLLNFASHGVNSPPPQYY